MALYVFEQRTEEAQRWVTGLEEPLGVTGLHRAEWAHALAQNVRLAELSAAQAREIRKRWERDQDAGLFVAVALPEAAWARCAALAQRWGDRLPVRTLDTLHVACALELEAERFWTLDARQAQLASKAGLRVRQPATPRAGR